MNFTNGPRLDVSPQHSQAHACLVPTVGHNRRAALVMDPSTITALEAIRFVVSERYVEELDEGAV